MKSTTKHLIAAIAADDPKEFERQFNEQMTLLSDNNPQVTLDISNGFKAVIQYEVEESHVETVKDEFHLEGIRLHDIETDSRRKWVTCRYSENGETHLDHECCNYFYKQLKLGQVRPGEPNRSGQFNKAVMRK